MSKANTLHTLLIVLLVANLTQAQSIWPGDVNNNGIVNGVDVLQWGIAYGKTGPSRNPSSTVWQAQSMPGNWAWSFPGGVNYAYADANGNGKVDNADASLAIDGNFGKIHSTPANDTWSPVASYNPLSITLQASTQNATPGNVVEVDLSVGGPRTVGYKMYGLTFTFSYDPALVQGGFAFEKEESFWIDPSGQQSFIFVKNDATNGKVHFAVTRLNQVEATGFGKLGKFTFVVKNTDNANKTLKLTLESIKAIDNNMLVHPVSKIDASLVVSSGGQSGSPCPDVISPVCGSNGKIYLNSCYAEAAGVMDYTEGLCYTGCVNPTLIKPNTPCPTVYEPVCGCNGITYANACEAEAAGVTAYSTGPCSENTNCYDPGFVLTSNIVVLSPTSGVISINAPTNYDPVCGCNGVTYTNSFVAEANGITYYTKGQCSTTCVDPTKINPDAVCPTNYDPVCGCNGVTYTNECTAKAAGVLSYTAGNCGASSTWCDKAVSIQCGDFLSNETTSNASNNISSYPGCSNKTYGGPEKVYVINKTGAGDLQIGLEILTQGLDLDMFLLSANCSQVTCLKASTTNNTQSNNEGILLEDAPIGTYYLVVDGAAAGQYRLEVSCGYLFCSDAIALDCGQAFHHTNANGDDNVSLYGCEGTLNVENNGPEVVHYFTIVQAGIVEINLTNLSSNLELFLLQSCNRGSCIEFSQNSGSSNEYISAYLQPGTYYVVIDGYNGAVSNYTLTVNCNSYCNLDLSLSATPASCGQNNGSIKVTSTGGSPNYLVSYVGPVSGSFTTSSSVCTIYNLPPGTYKVTKTDCKGCSDMETITVPSSGGLSFTATVTNAACNQFGSIKINIQGGSPGFKIYLSGPVNQTYTTNNAWYTINDLPGGTYTIYVVDANGCSSSKTVTISQSEGNFYFTATPNAAACENLGSILIKTYNGSAPYNIKLQGPVSGTKTVNGSTFSIINLPGGTYTVTIEDANWCSYTKVVVVPTSELEIAVTPQNGGCGQAGSINVKILNGTPNFMISWAGPVSGNTTTSSTNYTIPNLPSGTYTINVKDANWCNIIKTVTISQSEANFTIVTTKYDGVCEANGVIGVEIIGGQKPYLVEWDGPKDGSTIIQSNWYAIQELPAGSYTIKVKDANNCVITKTVQINIAESNLFANASLLNNQCGQYGSIWLDIIGGKASYMIEWDGPVDGSTTTNNTSYEIPNLPPGNYTIKIKDANWCMVTKYITVYHTPAVLFSATPQPGVCESPGSIKLTFSGGTPVYMITWSGAASGSATTNNSTFTIENLPAGSYTITVKDANGCTDSKTVQVNTAENSLSFNAALIVNECGQYNTIWIDIIGGSPTYMITWEGPVNGQITTNTQGYELPDLPPGKYTITVKDANWCAVSKMINIFETPSNLFTVSKTNAICETPGSIKLNFTGGMPIYSISWTGPAPGNATTNSNMFTIENLFPGTYTVTVTDSKGCVQSQTVEIIQAEGGLNVQTALIVNDCGQYNTIWVDVTGGTPTYTIIWEGPVNGMQTTNEAGFEIMDLPPGKYTITIKDMNWCYVSVMVMVFETPVNIFSATPNNGACALNGSISLAFTGTAPYQLSWNGPSTGSTSVNGSSYNIPNLPSGTYTISVTDAKGCVETEAITLNNGTGGLAATIAGMNGNAPNSGKILINITAGTAPYMINWTGASSGMISNNATSYEISNLPAGNYTVTVKDASNCTITKDLVITITENILSATATALNGSCNQLGAILVNISGGTPNYNIAWNGTGAFGAANTNGNSFTISNLPAGTYTITVKDANNQTQSLTVQVFGGTSSLVVTTNAVNGACGQPGQIQVTNAGGTAPYTITWSGSVNGTITTGSTNYNIAALPSGSYTIAVTDAGGCSQTKTVSVNNTNEQLAASFSFTTSGATANFINQSSSGTYSWAFGDGTSSTAANPSHTYSNNSTYNVCLTVTNSCGSQTSCKEVTIGVPANILVIDVQDLSGSNGSTIYVPVAVENCITANILSMAGSLAIDDPSVATITGLLPGSITPQFSVANKTFSYFANNGTGVPCGEGQILFYVAVQLIGSPGTATTLNIVSTPLPTEVGGLMNGTPTSIPHVVLNGQISVSNTAEIAGSVTTYWGDGIAEVEVAVTNPDLRIVQMAMTDEEGHYELPEMLMETAYTIQPSKDAQPENGLSTYALFAGQRFILGMEPEEIVSPYQIIAGDANCDGKFSSLDLFLIQRLIIGTSNSFGNCPSWVFVRAGDYMPIEFNTTNVFPYTSVDTMTLMKDTISNFIGIKVGDILGHANPALLQQVETRNDRLLRLVGTAQVAKVGEVIEIPITAENFHELGSYQLGLSFDVAKLTFVGLNKSSNPLLSTIALGDQQLADGILRLSWFDATGAGVSAKPDEILFTLKFRTNEEISDLGDILQINTRYIRAEAYTATAEPFDIALSLSGSVAGAAQENAYDYKLYQNAPNPFHDRTVIGFDLPKDIQAEIVIFDNLGKVVQHHAGHFTKGYNRIEFPRESLPGGVYYYALRTNEFSETRSMVILK